MATCHSLVGCWGTNQRSTRVQRICKKLQTVRGAGELQEQWGGAFSAGGAYERGGELEGGKGKQSRESLRRAQRENQGDSFWPLKRDRGVFWSLGKTFLGAASKSEREGDSIAGARKAKKTERKVREAR